MSKPSSIGIDVGGTKTLFALFDEAFELVHEIKVKTEATEEEGFRTALTEGVRELLRKADKGQLSVSAVGVGCAGSIDSERGKVVHSTNIPCLTGFSFQQALAKLTGAPVLLANDVNAALYGEHKLGAASGHRHVIGVFIGTGIGAALILDGKLYLGASGHAGDIGHYLLQPLGPLAGSDRHGILDDVASRTAIAGEAAVLAARQQAPHLLETVGTDVRDIKSSALAEAIKSGDQSVEELVRSRARIVGIVLSNLVDFLNPEMVVLGGGLTLAMPKIVREEVTAGIEAHATADARKGLQVVTSALKEHAATAGAARLALDTASSAKVSRKT